MSRPQEEEELSTEQFLPFRTVTQTATMSSGAAPTVDPDADFYYDYETLRIGGLVFAGVIVVLSVLLLTGNHIRRCGKRKAKHVDEDI
ncbi:hypothetical protein G5714_014908 [Onychostoma macrolepis]|uniref:FXYD domain-containing ion transport regulator n=1 Tax=Onychostoma macrolepis TaxID=369639 RepID=A0A7J6CA39_9TELE|nr:hypothetical protein G5714_014908 [Onychostoma macrolepis]